MSYKKIQLFISITAVFFSGALLTYSFSEPANLPPGGSKIAPITTSSLFQSKPGLLAINFNKADIGLIVSGNSNTGFVGIAVQNPTEKLDVLGDFFLTGLIKPNGIPGSSDQILTINSAGTGLEWKDKYSWLSLTSAVSKPPLCGNGSVDPGETCSNCIDAACSLGTVCWLGSCIPPPPPTGPSCGNGSCEVGESCSSCTADCGTCSPPNGCGDGTLDYSSGEQCELNNACPPAIIESWAGAPALPTFSIQPQLCDQNSCRCINTYIPPFPVGTPCGGVAPQCAGVCPGTMVCQPNGAACDCLPPPPPNCGFNASGQCGGACPAGLVCTEESITSCRCLPPEPPLPSNTEHYIPSTVANRIEGLPYRADVDILKEVGAVKIAEAAGCAGITQPQTCPNGWSQYNLICATLADNSSLWVRNCFK